MYGVLIHLVVKLGILFLFRHLLKRDIKRLQENGTWPRIEDLN